MSSSTKGQAVYERGEPTAPAPSVRICDAKWKVLVGAVQDGKLSRPYRYTVEKPADGWTQHGFDDHAWRAGLAPFASGNEQRTEWNTPEVYFRQTFRYGSELKHGAVVIRHNDNTEVYVNDRKIVGVRGSKGYYLIMATEELNKALCKGANTIAVHSHEGGRGQFIDLALLAD